MKVEKNSFRNCVLNSSDDAENILRWYRKLQKFQTDVT